MCWSIAGHTFLTFAPGFFSLNLYVLKRVSHPHGKILGGSSAINMMMYARGSPEDYNTWETLGASQWSWRYVEPYFKRLENAKNIPRGKKRSSESICRFRFIYYFVLKGLNVRLRKEIHQLLQLGCYYALHSL